MSTKFAGYLHIGLAIFWMVPVYPITLWVVFNQPEQWSMALLQFFSLYALTSTHWGAYQAVKAEKQAKESSE